MRIKVKYMLLVVGLSVSTASFAKSSTDVDPDSYPHNSYMNSVKNDVDDHKENLNSEMADKVSKIVSLKQNTKDFSEEDKQLIAAGGAIFQATCVGCHGVDAGGGVGPRLAGLNKTKIVNELKDFRNGKTDDDNDNTLENLMIPQAKLLSNKDITALSYYLSSLNKPQ